MHSVPLWLTFKSHAVKVVRLPPLEQEAVFPLQAGIRVRVREGGLNEDVPRCGRKPVHLQTSVVRLMYQLVRVWAKQ